MASVIFIHFFAVVTMRDFSIVKEELSNIIIVPVMLVNVNLHERVVVM